MANGNIEGSASDSMANSQSSGKGSVRDWIKTVWQTNQLTGGSGGSRGGGKGKTGNGWTPDDYKNYGDWQQRHYDMHDASQDKKTYREGIAAEHAADLKNDYQTIRNNEDLLTDIQRQRASKSIRGYGAGNQGGSRQQTTPGGRKATSGTGAAIGGKVGAVAGAAISKTPTGAAVGSKVGAKVGNAIESKVVNRKPKA